jgi:hypothetical protein
MQANPEAMCYLITGRTATRVEVWRTMATFLGQWVAISPHLPVLPAVLRLQGGNRYLSSQTSSIRQPL